MKSRMMLFLMMAMIAANAAVAKPLSVTGHFVTFDKGSASPLQALTIAGSLDKDVPETHCIAIYPDKEFQTLEGIGGAFNENGGQALQALPQAEQQQVLQALFGVEGAAFTFNRLPVGATDFSLDAYSFSETPDDYDMEHFSFDRERKYMLPYVKAAYAVNGEMMLQSSPWSPPGWMKGSGLMDKNDKNKQSAELRDDPGVYAAYAKYLVKFVQAYAKEGIRVDRLCIQNEPDTYAYFPGCYMTVEQMTKLTAGYLKPAFRKARLKTELWAGTFRTVGRADHLEALNKKFSKTFDGIGFQYAKGYSIKEAQLLYPKVPLMHTEGNCRHGENSAEHAALRMEEMADYINSGTSNFCYWNLILNEESSSTWGWKQNALITIDRQAKTVTYNPDFNAMYIASRTLRPGDVRIGSFSRMPIITVKGKDGQIKVLVQNESDKNKPVSLEMAGRSCRLVLPPKALCALTIQPE